MTISRNIGRLRRRGPLQFVALIILGDAAALAGTIAFAWWVLP
jgi:hypothetical protein